MWNYFKIGQGVRRSCRLSQRTTDIDRSQKLTLSLRDRWEIDDFKIKIVTFFINFVEIISLEMWTNASPKNEAPYTDGTSFVYLLCFCSVLCCYVFVHFCLCVLCGRLLGEGGAGFLALVCRVWLWVYRFPIGILGQVWYLIVSIPDLCTLTYFPFIFALLSWSSAGYIWLTILSK